MSASVSPITKNAPEPADPLRVELAAAIKAKESADAAVEAHRSIIGRARRAVENAEQRVDECNAGVDGARSEDAALAVTALKEISTGAAALKQTSAMASARYAQQNAADQLAVAREALTRLEAEVPALMAKAQWATNDLIAAVNKILAPIAEALLTRAGEVLP